MRKLIRWFVIALLAGLIGVITFVITVAGNIASDIFRNLPQGQQFTETHFILLVVIFVVLSFAVFIIQALIDALKSNKQSDAASTLPQHPQEQSISSVPTIHVENKPVIQVNTASAIAASHWHEIPWQTLPVIYHLRFDHVDSTRDDADYLRQVLNVWYIEEEYWSTSVYNGIYTLSGAAPRHVSRYVSFGLSQRDISASPIAVDVKIDISNRPDATQDSGCGILYHYINQQGKAAYYAYTLLADGRLSLYRRTGEQTIGVFAANSPHVKSGAFNRLGIRSHKNSIALYVNDQLVHIIEDRAAIQHGLTGLIVIGTGIFSFRDFYIHTFPETPS
jgi:large-conductance mechanosensitive channel